ncbi:cysteine--tRNA ligase [Reichenbachiella sp. 5M10]|uniref:cysteine--tRNA ligase n=1 Tax=Reichenbachiella sp. 5M10 TaxID=1889772 RepID=UPI000C15CCD4|nr:cysteine--tRNA ligase [Reichenbachiella sp. 5M10]PIB37272.1 cysteine--tRNA ligase [Reichenbachiella sp. 5M10]
MLKDLRINNSLSGKKELFEPLHAPFVGMYVCGPTVYSDVHLGNVRTFVSFDVIYRYLMHLGYKVRYVRNITDVGHLVNDADSGEDKIGKKAKLENIEPMEVVQRYTQDFHLVMEQFNALAPSIEPSATGHILEQIELIQVLLEKGLAYEVNGSVYFDVNAYQVDHDYGKLSGRKIEELLSNTRALDGQDEKRNSVDFALWKSAEGTDHIMRWNSPWGEGFPGWHLECTVMGTKYLGKSFDIHGGGMDLKFPHHECEMAQSIGAHEQDPVKYWLHTNMLTVNGQKMSKSLNNSFLPHELFSGDHELLERPYSPMTVRFFMLQSHYASTLDFSNDALLAAHKGYRKLINGLKTLRKLKGTGVEAEPNEKAIQQINQICDNCYRAMNDDFNTALTIGHLFNLLKKINNLQTQNLTIEEIGEETYERMKMTYETFVLEVLGLKEESNVDIEGLMDILIQEYAVAKEEKNYDKVDALRSSLKTQGIVLKDMKTGIDWAYEE